MAAQEGKVDVVRLLTEAGAQLNIQTKVQHWYSCMCHMTPCSSTSSLAGQALSHHTHSVHMCVHLHIHMLSGIYTPCVYVCVYVIIGYIVILLYRRGTTILIVT